VLSTGFVAVKDHHLKMSTQFLALTNTPEMLLALISHIPIQQHYWKSSYITWNKFLSGFYPFCWRLPQTRHEAIMLQNLSTVLLSCAQKKTYHAFQNWLLSPKLYQHNWLIMLLLQTTFLYLEASNIVSNSLDGFCFRVFWLMWL